jgi:twinkle protein
MSHFHWHGGTIIGVWRNKKLEDEIRVVAEAADRSEAGAQAKLGELNAKPPVVVNVAKQRNGDWEGKFGLWFSLATYQYCSAHDNRLGQRFLPAQHAEGEAA